MSKEYNAQLFLIYKTKCIKLDNEMEMSCLNIRKVAQNLEVRLGGGMDLGDCLMNTIYPYNTEVSSLPNTYLTC